MIKTYGLLVVASLLAAPVRATELHVLGGRAMGMGGAGVAAAEGPVGVYWNPATLGRAESPSGAQLPLGAHAELTGDMLEGANDINDIAQVCQRTPGVGLCTQPNIDAAIAKLNRPGNGMRADLGGGLALKIKRAAIFVNNLTYLGLVPKADVLAANTLPANFATANQSKVTIRGLSVTELGLAYGHELPFAPGVFMGAAIKALVGKAGYYDMFLRTDEPGNNMLSNLQEGAKTSVAPGLDIGALWDLSRSFSYLPMHPRFGLTARNINNPKFDNPDQAKAVGERANYPLQSNLRLGAAINPFSFWTVAADMDLTRNLTPVDGVASRQLSLGTEVNLFNRSWFNIPLRAGITRNVAVSGAKTAFTFGSGINLLHFTADLSAMVSPATQQIRSQEKNEKFPSNLAVAAQVGLQFGGGPDAAKSE
jgi:hypothetical protein